MRTYRITLKQNRLPTVIRKTPEPEVTETFVEQSLFAGTDR
jgi:hypothetical protein